ncbi:MAG: SPOR domain-containing protein [Bdellovibrionales bacterium]|nr:SPOR domain-containing protein [Bdellovibrionales bacterium]
MGDRRSGNRTDTIIKLLMVLFISLFSFSVGTFFGKKTTESALRRAALEQEGEEVMGEEERETASIPPGHMDVKPEDALNEDDLDNFKDMVVKKDDHKDPHGKESHKPLTKEVAKKGHGKEDAHHDSHEIAEKPIHEKVSGNIKAVQKVADRIAKGETPIEKVSAAHAHQEKREPSSLPASVAADTIGKFTVQISSHQAAAEAEKIAAQYKAKGVSAFVIPADVNGVTWYRVSVGLFPTQKEAASSMDALKKEGHIKTAFVQKITSSK